MPTVRKVAPPKTTTESQPMTQSSFLPNATNGAGNSTAILLRHGQLTTVASFRSQPERYAFTVGIHGALGAAPAGPSAPGRH